MPAASDPSPAPAHQPSRAVAAALALVALIALADLLIGERAVLISLLVVGPLVAAVRATPGEVAAVGVLATIIAVVLALVDTNADGTERAIALVSVGAVSALAVGIARVRRGLEEAAHQHGTELEAERRARRSADLLARSGALLETPLDPGEMLRCIAELPVPDHAELAIIDLLQDDGTLRGAVIGAANGEVATALHELRERFPLDAAGEHPVARALRFGAPQLLAEMGDEDLARFSEGPEHLDLMHRARYRSAMVLPLTARGRTSGVLSLLRLGDGAPFDDQDLALGLDIARRAALAIDNARLYQELRGTERRLEAILGSVGEAVSAVAPDGTLVFTNQAARDLVGPRLAGDDAETDVRRLHEGWVFLDERGNDLALDALPLARALRGEEPGQLMVRTIERATGRERWLVTRATPVRGDDGALQLVVAVGEDVTDVKRQETRERLLSNATKLLGSSLDVEATLDKTAWAVVPELADWARLDLVDERGGVREAAVAHRDLEKVELLREWRRAYPPDPRDSRGPWEVLRAGRPVVWDHISPDDVARYARDEHHAEYMRSIDTRSMLIVPLRAGDQVIGSLSLATTGESARMLGAFELEVAEELAARAAIAVENARVHAVRTHIATTLQRSLLPPRLPVIPGLSIAARFRAAGTATEVGGDFYDLFEGRGGWMVMIGDVTGKGPAAAAITSLARYTMRTVAQYEDDPEAMVQRLNAALAADPERRQICTAVCVAVPPDVDGGVAGPDGAIDLRVVCAGHPSPLLVRRAGAVEAVGNAGTLLGAFPSGSWRAADVRLAPGDALVLYTDGVTDTRGPEGRLGGERLQELLAEIGPCQVEEIAERLDDALVEFGEQRDDVAVLVLAPSARDDQGSAAIDSSAAA